MQSIVTLEVKPWDDETDLEAMLAGVKNLEQPGLLWGAHKFVAVGFGIKKLQINIVIGQYENYCSVMSGLNVVLAEDELVSTDDLQERIQTELEDYVQSTDIAAMQSRCSFRFFCNLYSICYSQNSEHVDRKWLLFFCFTVFHMFCCSITKNI